MTRKMVAVAVDSVAVAVAIAFDSGYSLVDVNVIVLVCCVVALSMDGE